MKTKPSVLPSKILIIVMAALVLLIMIQMARAQSPADLSSSIPVLAQAGTQGDYQNNNPSQVLQTNLPQKNLGRRIWDDTTLGYYQQFLGPTASGSPSETYNIFQEGIDSPGTGRAPLQSFHAVNLRHQINTDWAVGATLSATNSYTEAVENKNKFGKFNNEPDTQFFNARAYVSIPSLKLPFGTLFTTLSFEAPTSEISKGDEMRYGLVVSQSLAFTLPDVRWNAGLTGQIYRMYYKTNTPSAGCDPGFVCDPIELQTMIISGGPYINYRMNDFWMLGSAITLDYDQRGIQSGSGDFNSNLPHRGRINLTYFPKIKYVQSVGIFTQALLKYRHETTAFGADLAVRF